MSSILKFFSFLQRRFSSWTGLYYIASSGRLIVSNELQGM